MKRLHENSEETTIFDVNLNSHHLNVSAYVYNKWSQEEDEKLRQAINLFGEFSWRTVSDYVGSRDNSKLYISVISSIWLINI